MVGGVAHRDTIAERGALRRREGMKEGTAFRFHAGVPHAEPGSTPLEPGSRRA
jgi:hypothetical protein